MSAIRLMPRKEWEDRLRNEHRCKPLETGRPGLENGEWWVTEHDRLFPVSVDRLGNMRTDDWQHIIVRISQLKPLDWDT